MSDQSLSKAEVVEALTGIGKLHAANVKRAQQQREQAEQQIALLASVLKRRSPTMPLEVYRYYQIAESLHRKMLSVLDLMALAEYTVPNVAQKPLLELATAELQFITNQGEAIHFGRLYHVLQDDLALALEGKPPTRPLPKIWAERRERIAGDKAWREALERFMVDLPIFTEGVKAVEGIWPELQATEPRERAAALKELNVAGLAGQAFRIRGIFRVLDGGEAFLDAFAVPMPRAPKPRGDGKKITDRLTGIFRGTNG
jgi:hypothetical protein